MAAAVVKDGRFILSSIVSTQDVIHHKYGGIVPELASRRHLETIIPVVKEALEQAGVTLDDIDAIGVTQGPGLVGSILIGLSFAKAVAYVKDIPFVGVNHIQAHPMAVFLEKEVRSQGPAPAGFKQGAEEIPWTNEASERLSKAPFFLRAMVKKGVERYAREKRLKEITPDIMAELRKRAGRK